MFKKDEIKKAILEGGLIFADRGSGKSQALADIIQENDDCVVVVHNEAGRKNMIRILQDRGVSPSRIRTAVITPPQFHEMAFTAKLPKKVYGDELFASEMPCNDLSAFDAVVTSINMKVNIIP